MSEEYWKAALREEARRELVRRAAADQKTVAEFCAAWFAMAARLGLAERAARGAEPIAV